mmetsp:Transcript_4052/g.9209  ORF Transcript_4052/g.9209 Transcript_4052/m.9209 type:complete len:420 (+) Transcript_4052:60-1319(+)
MERENVCHLQEYVNSEADAERRAQERDSGEFGYRPGAACGDAEADPGATPKKELHKKEEATTTATTSVSSSALPTVKNKFDKPKQRTLSRRNSGEDSKRCLTQDMDEAANEMRDAEMISDERYQQAAAAPPAQTTVPRPAADDEFWLKMNCMFDHKLNNFGQEFGVALKGVETRLGVEIKREKEERLNEATKTNERIDSILERLTKLEETKEGTDITERLEKLELRGACGPGAGVDEAERGAARPLETRQGLAWTSDTLIIGGWPEHYNTEQRERAAETMMRSLGADLSHLPARGMSRPGSIVKVRFESAPKAARAQYHVELCIAQDKKENADYSKLWCALERPPSIQAKRKALLLARDKLLEWGAVKEDYRIDYGAETIMKGNMEILILKKGEVVVGRDWPFCPFKEKEWRHVAVPRH